ncbi:MAG: Hpt domain-containing protein [Planctomycetota bacterium]|jgi:chemotaxis protein histidine kinase CheA
MSDNEKSILTEFVEEAMELLEEMENACSGINGRPVGSEAFAVLERGLHTIKGNANALGFSGYGRDASLLLETVRSACSDHGGSVFPEALVRKLLEFIRQSGCFLSSLRDSDSEESHFVEKNWNRIIRDSGMADSAVSDIAAIIDEMIASDATEELEPDLLAMMIKGIPDSQNNAPKRKPGKTRIIVNPDQENASWEVEIEEILKKTPDVSPRVNLLLEMASRQLQKDKASREKKISTMFVKGPVFSEIQDEDAPQTVPDKTPESCEDSSEPKQAPGIPLLKQVWHPAISSGKDGIEESDISSIFGYACEALCATGTAGELETSLGKSNPELLVYLNRITDIMVNFGHMVLEIRQSPLSGYLEDLARWAEELATSLDNLIKVDIKCEGINVLPGVGRFICQMIKEVFSFALPLRKRDGDKVVPITITVEKNESLVIRIIGFPSFMRATTNLRLFTLQKRMEATRGRIGLQAAQDEVTFEFPNLLFSLEVLVAKTGTSQLGIPAHRILEIIEIPPSNGDKTLRLNEFEWNGKPVEVMNLMETPASAEACIVLLRSSSGIVAVAVDGITQRKEMLIKPDINEHPGVVIIGSCIAVEDGDRIPLLNPHGIGRKPKI